MKTVPLSHFPCGQLGLSPGGELWEAVLRCAPQTFPTCVVKELGMYPLLLSIMGRGLLWE